jgi:hypothetical protein
MDKLAKKYFWPTMREDVEAYCKACEVCQEVKSPNRPGRQSLRSIAVNGVFERIAMDILGPLPMTYQGNKYVLVIQEYLTKWPVVVALSDQTANTVAKALVEQVFLVYGVPRILLTDRGTNFTSQVIREINEYWGVKQSFTTPYHPQTDGMVERFNRTLTTMLASHVQENQRNWDDLIPYVTYAYRITVHASTKETPFFLMFGRDPTTPFDQIMQSKQCYKMIEEPDYAQTMIHHFQKAWTKAKENIVTSQTQAEKYYKNRPIIFRVGDLVRVHNPAVKKGRTHKLSRMWKGPYRVMEIKNTSLILQKVGSPSILQVVHMNRCKKVHMSEIIPLQRASDEEIGDNATLANEHNLTDVDMSEMDGQSSSENTETVKYGHGYNLRSRQKIGVNVLFYLFMSMLFLLVNPSWGETFKVCHMQPIGETLRMEIPNEVNRVFFWGQLMARPQVLCSTRNNTTLQFYDPFGRQHFGRIIFQWKNMSETEYIMWEAPSERPQLKLRHNKAICVMPYQPCINGAWILRTDRNTHIVQFNDSSENRGVMLALANDNVPDVYCCWDALATQNNTLRVCENYGTNEPAWVSTTFTVSVPAYLKYQIDLPDDWNKITCGYMFNGFSYNSSMTMLPHWRTEKLIANTTVPVMKINATTVNKEQSFSEFINAHFGIALLILLILACMLALSIVTVSICMSR